MRTIFALTLAAAILLSACSDDEAQRLVGEATSTTTTTVPEGVAFVDEEPIEQTVPLEPLTLRVGLPDLVFDPPHLVDESDPTAVLITDLLTDGLTALDGSGQVIAALADSWDVSDDGLVWTFALGSYEFSTGTAVTANDVVASLNRTLDRGNASLTAAHLDMISAIAPVDDSTVRVELLEPTAEIAEIFAGVAFGIVPADETAGSDLPVSSSINFTPTSWLDDGIRLVGDQVEGEISTIELLLDGDGLLVEANAVDVSVTDAGTMVGAGASGSRVYFGMDVTDGPLADSDVRRAVALAVDGNAIQSEFFPTAAPMTGFLPWPSDSCGEACDFDPESAKALIEASGAGEQEFFVDYFQVEGDDFEQRLAEAIVSQLRAAGLVATARAHPVSEYGTKIANGDVDLFRFGTAFSTGTGLGDLASSFGAAGNDNVSGLALTEVDALLDAAAVEMDAGDRRALYEEAEAAVFGATPVLPLAQLQTQVVLGNSLTRASFAVDGSLDLDAFVWAEAE